MTTSEIIDQLYENFRIEQKKKYAFCAIGISEFKEVIRHLILNPELLCKLTVAIINETERIKNDRTSL